MGFLFFGTESNAGYKKNQLEEVSDEDSEVRKVVKVNVSNIQKSSAL